MPAGAVKLPRKFLAKPPANVVGPGNARSSPSPVPAPTTASTTRVNKTFLLVEARRLTRASVSLAMDTSLGNGTHRVGLRLRRRCRLGGYPALAQLAGAGQQQHQ